MKRILLTVLALALMGGVASADRGRHRGHYKHRGASWSGGVVVTSPRLVAPAPRVYVQRHRVVRRPIYVQRPVIAYRYYNYYQRPQLVAENYAPMAGYYWVAGSWSWNGGEWIWQPGHYQPDPSYNDGYYQGGYQGSYSSGGYYDGEYNSADQYEHQHSHDCGHGY